jgi:uncharacterized LabA/DUF88 family protein
MAECDRLCAIEEVAGYELLRIYFYDAYPASDSLKTPVAKDEHKLAETERFRQSQSLFSQLLLKPNVALRTGTVNVSSYQWRLKPSVAKQLIRQPRPLLDDDFLIDAHQKGVDMRVGMDMARLALRDMVRTIIVVTGDSDFVPAFKFVRREGVRVILDLMGENGRVELKQHSDIVLGR